MQATTLAHALLALCSLLIGVLIKVVSRRYCTCTQYSQRRHIDCRQYILYQHRGIFQLFGGGIRLSVEQSRRLLNINSLALNANP